MFRPLAFLLVLVVGQSLSVDPELPPEKSVEDIDDSPTKIIQETFTKINPNPNGESENAEIPQLDKLKSQDLSSKLNITGGKPELPNIEYIESETSDAVLDLLNASLNRIKEYITNEFEFLKSFHSWMNHDGEIVPETELEKNTKEENAVINSSFQNMKNAVTREFELLKSIYKSIRNEIEIPESKNDENNPDEVIKMLVASCDKITDFITKEYELLKSNQQSHTPASRSKREAVDDLSKYFYFIDHINGDMDAAASEFITDDLPDIETNETEHVDHIIEGPTKTDVNEQVDHTTEATTKSNELELNENKKEDKINEMEQTTISPEPNNNPKESDDLKSAEIVKEVRENVESEVIEEPGQPKYTHISRSTIQRLSQSVPYHTNYYLHQPLMLHYF